MNLKMTMLKDRSLIKRSAYVCLHLDKTLENINESVLTKGQTAMRSRERHKGGITKENKKVFQHDNYVYSLDCDDSFIGV